MVLDSLVKVLVFVLGTLIGFVLPGLGLSRRFSSPIPACTTLLISILNLFLVVFVYQLIGVPLRFQYLAPTLALISTVCLYLGRNGSTSGLTISDWKARRGIAILIGLICLEMLIRTSMWPLSGADTGFRWGFLGTQIFDHGHFNYYPPLSAEDFEQYPMVDAIAPLISICYYWIYECCSGIMPRMTSVFVTVQYVLSLSLIFSCAKYMKNSAAGLLGAAIFSGSELSFWSVGMGQEMGLLAISLLGTFNLLIRVRRRNETSYILLAASVTAVGMLCREYGGLVLICGTTIVLCRRLGLRALVLYIVLSFILCGGWYIRSWILTGNPFYSIKTLPFFSVHQRYNEMMHAAKLRNIWTIPIFWWGVKLLGVLSTLPFLFGPFFIIAQTKKRPYFLLSGLVVIGVWIISVPQTANIQYSFRVLHMLVTLLCVGSGILVERWSRNSVGRVVAILIVPAFLIWNIVNMSVFPNRLRLTKKSEVFGKIIKTDYRETLDGLSNSTFEIIESNLPAGSKVVTLSCYHWIHVYRRNIQVVSDFSPEADALFAVDHAESLRTLKEQKIRVLVILKTVKKSRDKTFLSHIVNNGKNLADANDSVEIYRID
ncbi:MAG: hypothetical protein P1V97_15670 [Planctomycetota bacterium]|nr:hypothetical protein [Planctomycetota bacterium]